MKNRTQVVFLHGLNTHGDDLMRTGSRIWGRMDEWLIPPLTARGLDVLSVNGIGYGTPESQAEVAKREILRALPEHSEFVLLGNSLGGLVARVLQHDVELRSRVRGVLTWGTPHHGAPAATPAVEWPSRHPWINTLSRALGQDLIAKREAYEPYTPASLRDFNARFPATGLEHSFLCLVPARDVLGVFWPITGLVHDDGFTGAIRRWIIDDDFAPSDGFIPRASQAFGQIHGPFALDHFVQIGMIHLYKSSARRAKAQREFARLCDELAEVAKSLANSANPIGDAIGEPSGQAARSASKDRASI